MKNDKEIYENCYGCVPLGTCALIVVVVLILIMFGSCKPSQKIVEVERWQHDTTTVVDTVHIKDVVVRHDSIYVTEYVTQFVKDSTETNVAWKHYTYDDKGNITSLTDYTSSTQHGSVAHTTTENTQSNVSDNLSIHDEKSSHGESSGHGEAIQSKTQEKRGLSGWQRFIQALGYTFLVLLVVGIGFGGLRLYGKWKKL